MLCTVCWPVCEGWKMDLTFNNFLNAFTMWVCVILFHIKFLDKFRKFHYWQIWKLEVKDAFETHGYTKEKLS